MTELTERTQIENYTDGPLRFVSSLCESVFVMHSKFQAFEGDIDVSRHIKIGLNIGRTANYYRHSDVGVVDEDWRRNGIVLTLPHDVGSTRSSAVNMMGVAIDLKVLSVEDEHTYSLDSFSHMASKVTMDPVAAQYIRELMDNAELHGCSSAFFSHSLGFLLRRLTSTHSVPADTDVAPLDELRLNKVIDLMEADLGDDLTVRGMAAEVAMDITNFAKAFRGATGMPPFAYLTQRRMNAAKSMLQHGHNVTSIALSLNYSNPSKFSAAFKRCVGHSPTDWMKLQKG